MRHEIPPAAPNPRPKLVGDVGVTVVLGTIAVLYFAREVLIPFAFALTFTFLLAPVVTLLQRLRGGRAISVLTAVLVSLGLAGGIGWIIANQLVDVANQLPGYRENIQAKIKAFHVPMTGQLGDASKSVQEVIQELNGPGAAAPAAAPPEGNKKQPHGPPAPASPISVSVVQPPSSGWAGFRDLGTPLLSILGRASMVV